MLKGLGTYLEISHVWDSEIQLYFPTLVNSRILAQKLKTCCSKSDLVKPWDINVRSVFTVKQYVTVSSPYLKTPFHKKKDLSCLMFYKLRCKEI